MGPTTKVHLSGGVPVSHTVDMDLLPRRTPIPLPLRSGLGLGAVLAVMAIGPGPSSGAVAQAPAAGLATATKAPSVQVGDFFFRPAKLRIPHGATVTWTWVGMQRHNVVFPSLKRRSPKQVSGTYHLRFTRPGVYRYLCTIHGFRGTVVVH